MGIQVWIPMWMPMRMTSGNLCSPVASVVQPQHVVAKELEEPEDEDEANVGEDAEGPADTVPDDGAPQVAHVHLLGDVGR